jgi:hypothetical protein
MNHHSLADLVAAVFEGADAKLRAGVPTCLNFALANFAPEL